jgi:hypothetical protein
MNQVLVFVIIILILSTCNNSSSMTSKLSLMQKQSFLTLNHFMLD